MQISPSVAATVFNGISPGDLAPGGTVHGRAFSQGYATLVAEVSDGEIRIPATGVRPAATMRQNRVASPRVVTIVTDQSAVETSTASPLTQAGYRVVMFASVEAFLATDLPSDPECVLVDMQMPGDGLRVLRELGRRETIPPVLMFSGRGDIHEAVEAMKLGAFDFLEKPYQPESLLAAISNALATGPKRKSVAIDRDAAAKIASLSKRELQVLQGMVMGKPNKIIAYELGLSIRTVESYRAQLLIKLSVRGTADAVRLAMAAGVL